MRTKPTFFDSLRYRFTVAGRTEDFYRLQYERMFRRHYSRKYDCLKVGPLFLPLMSHSEFPTREEAYYAMEIGDIIYPALLGSFRYVDEGPYELGDVGIEEGDVVFDCGANLGVFSLLAAYRGAEVYAFEPISAARAELRRTLDLNPELKNRVHVVPAALSDTEGTAEFTVLDGTLVGSSMVLSQQGRKETARLTTVDAFCEAEGVSPDFIKADIEGAERQMMKGAVETLARDAPKISICTYHFKDDAEVLRGIIKGANPVYRISEKWKKMYAKV